MFKKGGFVYIMSSPNRNTLYTGVTSDLKTRVYEHRNKVYPGSFTSRYNCMILVYYNQFGTIADAIEEEKRVKGSSRKTKEVLIESMNREWKDLSEELELW